ncbi:hypothetical protein KC19_9G084800 [Ceratodon purpureus]|uniref:Uncharacterized protein n=1 Tax=Ceratodon purpureus TaxID=3225 RepID=A0A8T0GSZ8_CERPU|nr:hypothetical protein KC19_9G084800 [Ceratodon purpureus]
MSAMEVVGCAHSAWQLLHRPAFASMARFCSVAFRRHGVKIRLSSWGGALRVPRRPVMLPLRVASLRVEPVSELKPSPLAQGEYGTWVFQLWELDFEVILGGW